MCRWVWKTYGMGMQDALDANPNREIYMMIRQNEASITKIMEDFKPLLSRITDFQLGYKCETHLLTFYCPLLV